MVVGRPLSYWVLVTFQGRAVKLREGNPESSNRMLRWTGDFSEESEFVPFFVVGGNFYNSFFLLNVSI